MAITPSASYSFTVRLEIKNTPGMLGRVTSVIGKAGGDIGTVDLAEMTSARVLRDITIKARDSGHAHRIIDRLRRVTEVRIANISDRTFLMHLGGKIEIKSKVPIRTRDDLSMAYTPGVARVCLAIRDDPERAFTLTIRQNTVAVVTDGTAVLGLGDIGPEAAMPVMEGKCLIFAEFAGITAFPLCLDTKDPEEIVRTVTHLAPAFGGINLEDIAAPSCSGENEEKRAIARELGTSRAGTLDDALKDAHVFIGLSGPRVLSLAALRTMARPRIVFALANPDPEIDPLQAAPEVDILATGRSDYPNQVNNSLVFPGVFRGLLDAHARGVSPDIELAAADALAATVPAHVRSAEYILPSMFDKDVVPTVAKAVASATRSAGLSRRSSLRES